MDAAALFDAQDREALALELRSARRVSRPLRRAVADITALAVLEAAKAAQQADAQDGTQPGQIPPTERPRIRAALTAAITALRIDLAAQVAAAVAAAVALALRQETAALGTLGIDAKTLAVKVKDPVLSQAAASIERTLGSAVDDALKLAASSPLATEADVQAVAAKAAAVVPRVEAGVRFLTNRAVNQATLDIARAAAPITPPPAPSVPRTPIDTGSPAVSGEPPLSANGRSPLVEQGLRVVWVAERGACLTCLALSGHVADPNAGEGFDEFATFGRPGSAPTVWPPGMPLMGPPRHPRCRCRLRIIAAGNTMVPEALKREAERSVARGWSDHASRRSRIDAAGQLTRRPNRLPRTVNERAVRDVERGRFSTRHRPRAPHLRAD